jgi:three-Cys-motif partner protein
MEIQVILKNSRLLNNNRPQTIPNFVDDGFSVTATEPWFKVKVQVIQNYLRAFVTSAASRADEIIFVDLFSGSGLYSVGHQREIFAGAALTAMASDLPIGKWILCENDAEQAKILRARTDRYFPRKNIIVLEEHTEDLIGKFRMYIPPAKGGYKPAIFCLADLFSLNMPFALIEKLTALNFSFLIPFTFGLNAGHNCEFYVKDEKEKLKRYAGLRTDQLKETQSNLHFYKSLVKIYQHNLLMLGFNSSISAHKINSTLMDLQMYQVGYFSKQISPRQIHKDVQPVEQLQFELY